MADGAVPEQPARDAERRRRLAQALRDNLKRRKDQARARVAEDTPEHEPERKKPDDQQLL